MQVRWDDMEVNRLNRVSPWEIELSGPMSGPNSFVLPGTKRNRIGFPAAKADLPVHRGSYLFLQFGFSPHLFHSSWMRNASFET